MYTPPDLFSKALALLAFVIAFYALAVRERKTPYLTSSLYSTAFWIIFASSLAIVSQFIEQDHTSTARVLGTIAKVLLALGALNVTYGIWRVHNRHVNFRDDNLIKNLAIVRTIRSNLARLKPRPSYEHTAPSLFPDIREALSTLNGVTADELLSRLSTVEDDRFSKSIGYQRATLSQSDETLIALIKPLLGMGWGIQYTTCIRHPIEFVMKIHKMLSGSDLKSRMTDLLGQVVVVDAYTPHFGFTDSTHIDKALELKRLGVRYIKSRSSYAGVHTATAKAFNQFKKRHTAQGVHRKPTLIIYEGAHALVALESVEQYYIFLRHVLPSERMWGGMLTVFVEPTLSNDASDLLKSYVDVLIEPESARPEPSK
jgi:hypothetical protein